MCFCQISARMWKKGWGERLDSASISRATSFHLGGEAGELSVVFNFILMGLWSSRSENRVDDVGESRDAYGDFASGIPQRPQPVIIILKYV